MNEDKDITLERTHIKADATGPTLASAIPPPESSSPGGSTLTKAKVKGVLVPLLHGKALLFACEVRWITSKFPKEPALHQFPKGVSLLH